MWVGEFKNIYEEENPMKNKVKIIKEIIGKRITAVILSIMLLAGFIPLTGVQSVCAANTDINNAMSVSFGITYSDSITSTIDERYYKLTLPSSGRITITAEGDIKQLHFGLYNSDNNYMDGETKYRSDVTNRVNYNVEYDLTAGIYYLEIGENYDTGTYQFSINFVSANESFAESGKGINNDIHHANNIGFGTTYYGQLAESDDVDYYGVTLSSSGKVTMTAEGDVRGLSFYLYDSNGKQLCYETESRSSITNKVTYSEDYHIQAGQYYIAIKSQYHTGNYHFKLDFASANESFAETGADDVLGGANAILLNTTYNGQLALNHSDEDYYYFTVAREGAISIAVTSDMYGEIGLYNVAGNKLWNKNISKNESKGIYEALDTVIASPGTYYLRISSDNRTGNYSFRIANSNAVSKPAKVSISSVKSSKKKTFVVRWKKVNGADGYQIQYSKKKSFKGKKSIYMSASATKRTVKGLQRKKKYYVRVRAYKIIDGHYKYGSFSKVKRIKVK